jgi:hypothetical protein
VFKGDSPSKIESSVKGGMSGAGGLGGLQIGGLKAADGISVAAANELQVN